MWKCSFGFMVEPSQTFPFLSADYYYWWLVNAEVRGPNKTPDVSDGCYISIAERLPLHFLFPRNRMKMLSLRSFVLALCSKCFITSFVSKCHFRNALMACFYFVLFFFTVSLNCITRTAQVIIASGYEGYAVNISCSYPAGYESYDKYLCRNGCDDVLVETPSAKKGRYSISDDRQKRILTTTISDLSSKDRGQYWCGVTRTGTDIYYEVNLEVGKGRNTNTYT